MRQEYYFNKLANRGTKEQVRCFSEALCPENSCRQLQQVIIVPFISSGGVCQLLSTGLYSLTRKSAVSIAIQLFSWDLMNVTVFFHNGLICSVLIWFNTHTQTEWMLGLHWIWTHLPAHHCTQVMPPHKHHQHLSVTQHCVAVKLPFRGGRADTKSRTEEISGVDGRVSAQPAWLRLSSALPLSTYCFLFFLFHYHGVLC